MSRALYIALTYAFTLFFITFFPSQKSFLRGKKIELYTVWYWCIFGVLSELPVYIRYYRGIPGIPRCQ